MRETKRNRINKVTINTGGDHSKAKVGRINAKNQYLRRLIYNRNMSQIAIKQLEYLMIFVRIFAEHFSMGEKQAFNYLDRHKGFEFVKDHYEVMHTLDFDYAIEDIQEICRANGGNL